jgi:hypothetical protein
LFEGETDYRFVNIDGCTALRALCDASASGLVLRRTINLSKIPVLNWSWRIDNIYPDLSERTRAGDDFPAGIYVVHDGDVFK